VNSQITEDFLTCFSQLPDSVKALARKNYRLWRENPSHPSLQFKKLAGHDDLYSVRIGRGYRALGLVDGDTITWFWIGSHADYDNLLARI
jgi:mRNA-degrading endonuclease RelE of RelBE toxin-antitoxin system